MPTSSLVEECCGHVIAGSAVVATKDRDSAAVAPVSRAVRVGLMVDSPEAPAWVGTALREIEELEQVDIRLVIVNDCGVKDGRRSNAVSEMYRLWRELDYRLFRGLHDSLAPVAIDSRVTKAKVVHLTPANSEEAIAEIRAADLDVIVQAGQNAITPDLLDCAGQGTWYFADGDKQQAVTQLWRSAAHIETELCELDKTGVTHGVGRSVSSMDPVSVYRSENAANWDRCELLVRSLKHLRQQIGNGVPIEPNTVDGAEERRVSLGVTNTLRLIGRSTLRLLRNFIETHLYRAYWFIAFRPHEKSETNEPHTYTTVVAPCDRYYGDPFLVEHDGKGWLLFEDYRFTTRRGVISAVCIDAEGNYGEPTVVLEAPYHLSYPFVFEAGGELYMLPESSGNRTVELYRCVEFPHRWRLEKILLKGTRLVDPTIVRHEDRWWLFAAELREDGARANRLLLYYSDSLTGEWHPHPMNPIVCDVRSARPAGRLFVHGCDLIRPAQDCSAGYGAAVCLNRVEVLSITDYKEVPITVFRAAQQAGIRGLHTFNRSEHYEAVDAKVLLPRFGTYSLPTLRV